MPKPHVEQSGPSVSASYSSLHLAQKEIQTCQKTINTWPESEWNMFKVQYLEEYAETVLSYITYCCHCKKKKNKQTWVFPNQKPWMNSEVQFLIRHRRTGNKAQYSTARVNLGKGIKAAMEFYTSRKWRTISLTTSHNYGRE